MLLLYYLGQIVWIHINLLEYYSGGINGLSQMLVCSHDHWDAASKAPMQQGAVSVLCQHPFIPLVFVQSPVALFQHFYKVKIISGVKLQIISETFEVLIKCTNRCLSTLTERECSNMVFVQSRKSPVTVVSYVCPSRLLSVRLGSLQISKLGWI